MARMTEVSRVRPWPSFNAALFAGALPLYALGVPLGLARVEVASQVAAGLALDTSGEPASYGLIAMRLAQFIPLGDQSLRANLASAVLCALAVVLLGRLCLGAVALLRPPASARQDPRDLLREPIAASAAALAFALALSTFELGATGGSAAATLLILAAGLLAGFALVRDCGSAHAGYVLTGIAVCRPGSMPSQDRCCGRCWWAWLSGRCARERAGRCWHRLSLSPCGATRRLRLSRAARCR